MKDKELLFEIFSRNKRKCLDLFGKRIKMGKLEDASEKSSRVYINYFAFAQEILKAYKPKAGTQEKTGYIIACDPADLTLQEQEDITEMLEAIIDTVHYAKYKRSKKGVKKHE